MIARDQKLQDDLHPQKEQNPQPREPYQLHREHFLQGEIYRQENLKLKNQEAVLDSKQSEIPAQQTSLLCAVLVTSYPLTEWVG